MKPMPLQLILWKTSVRLSSFSRNSGSWFYSQDSLAMKLGCLIRDLHETRWRKPNDAMQRAVHDMVYLFHKKYEDDHEG